ncbi:MAG: radical SAM protein [Desulfobacteraceae bacterium]|nr:MAG: radical SAM protein [Desulfobacteraceae bacterium]
MKTILLFNPPDPQGRGFTREGRCTQDSGAWATLWPPVSLATISAFLKEDGHRVRIVDFPALGLSFSALREIVGRELPGAAIWSTGTPTIASDLGIGKLIKEISPETVTAVIGTHVTVLPEQALSFEGIDLVIRHEPERPAREICRFLEKREWERVAGISYRKGMKGEPLHNPDSVLLSPEEIPFADWDDLDIRCYRLPLKGRNFLIVAPIRGCPYQCSFCTAPIYYGKRLRKRPPARVADEIERNIRRHGVRDFFLWADTFTADKEYVARFSREIIERGLRITWTCNSRVDTLDRETLLLMKRAGLWMISLGLESGSDRILEASGKRISVAQSRSAVEMVHGLGIKTSGHFILGLPGESMESMRRTLSFALSLPLDIAQFYAAAPFPGTGLYREAIQNRWLPDGTDLSQDSAALELPGLAASVVDAFRRYAFRRFYMRPGAVLKLLSMVEPPAVRHMLATLSRTARWAG